MRRSATLVGAGLLAVLAAAVGLAAMITDSDPSATGYIFSVPIDGNQAVFIRLKVTSP